MLSLTDITYAIGTRTLIEETSLNIMPGWRVGVIGQNGAGKSTLFKIISGDIKPDGGSVSIAEGLNFGMVRQDIPETDTPLIDIVLAANERMAALMQAAETEQDGEKLADIYQQLIDMDAYSAPAKAATLLTGLGFKEEQLREPFSSFSGGWRMRVALAAALFVEPDVLLLDEPTNHLDLEAIMWLETYLASYPHTLLIISHDRDLLNKCIDHVVHVNKGTLTLYSGNYDTFEREQSARLGLQQKMHEKQQAQRAHMQSFIDRFKAKASKATQAQSRMKALERMDIVDAVIASRAIQFTFPNPDSKAPDPMIAIQNADIGYAEGKPVLRRVSENIYLDDRIALLGANGNGKSTLMKLIAGKLKALSGDVTHADKLRIGYFSQHQTEELDVNSTPYIEMRNLMLKKSSTVAEHAVRARLGAFGFSRDLADNTISSLSGGEKARLLFAFMSFDAPHLLLLDEPTNHLDIDAREALVNALNQYEGAIIIVSHDPTMLERVADRLWLVHDGKCQHFDGDLNDYRKFITQARRGSKRDTKKPKAEKPAPTAAKPNAAKPNMAQKRKIEALEKDIAKLTAEKNRYEADMTNDANFYKDSTKVQSYNALLAKLEAQETEYLELVA